MSITTLFLTLQLAVLALTINTCPSIDQIRKELGSSLSHAASIDTNASNAPRWSDYGAPIANYVVNVACESDVATTVRYAVKHNIAFLAQSRGNGWADTFHLGTCGLIINLIALNKITFNTNKTLATIQGAALVEDMIDYAYGNNTRFATPTCECLSFLGASLGGGLTREMGLYGIGADQVVSVNMVLASGETVFVDASHHTDLWFAVRGAVANFGIVTSATVKAYPTPQNQNVGFQGFFSVPDDQLGALITAIKDLDLKEEMALDVLFSTINPPAYTPTIFVIPLYIGSEKDGQAAFQSVLQLASAKNRTTEIPYPQWGAAGVSFCAKGLRKPAYGASTSTRSLTNTTAWIELYDTYKAFVTTYPAAANSSLLTEYYSVQRAVAMGREGAAPAAYPWRSLALHTAIVPQYASPALDGPATAFGARARDILRGSDGYRNATYINFAHGDETLEEIYGDSLARLKQLKQQYDPQNRFNQWFPISP